MEQLEKLYSKTDNRDLSYEDYKEYLKILFYNAEKIVKKIKREYSKAPPQYKNVQKDILEAVMFVVKRELNKMEISKIKNEN